MPTKVPEIGHVPVDRLFERFVAVEYFTSWPIAKAVKRADSETTIRFLYEEIFTVYNPPRKLLSDNGLHFSNREMMKFAEFVNVRHQFSAPYKPSTNGKVEQLNGTLVRGIRKLHRVSLYF